jgi:RNA polymerase sigma-70 factor (ECF subfamily)
MESAASLTGTTLFAVLEQPANNDAWSNFVNRYGPTVFQWCRQHGLQAADAEDVTQEVLGKFAKAARTFSYDRAKAGFRAWLRTVTKHALYDLVADYRQDRARGAARAADIFESLQAARDLEQNLEAEFRRELLDQAMQLVRERVEPKTWRAFELLATEGQPGKDVAQQLELSIAAAYMAKSRVQRMITEEVRRLEGLA